MLLLTAILYTIPLLFLMLPLLRLFYHITIKEAAEPIAFESAVLASSQTSESQQENAAEKRLLQEELDHIAGSTTDSPSNSIRFQRPIAIVTGANVGIGEETARGLWKRGYIVVMACRSLERATKAREQIIKNTLSADSSSSFRPNPDNLVIICMDLGDLTSVQNFSKEYRKQFDRLDVIVANAGVIAPIGKETKQGFEMTYGVCYLGHQLLFELMVPLMERSPHRVTPRIVILSSVTHKKAGKDVAKMYFKERMRSSTWPSNALGRGIPATSSQYVFVKLLNMVQTKLLHDRFHKQKGILVNAVHPGIVKSDISRDYTNRFIRWIMSYLFLSPEQGAQTSIHCASAKTIEEENLSGYYWSNCKMDHGIHDLVDDPKIKRLLWAETLDQLKDFLPEDHDSLLEKGE